MRAHSILIEKLSTFTALVNAHDLPAALCQDLNIRDDAEVAIEGDYHVQVIGEEIEIYLEMVCAVNESYMLRLPPSLLDYDDLALQIAHKLDVDAIIDDRNLARWERE